MKAIIRNCPAIRFVAGNYICEGTLELCSVNKSCPLRKIVDKCQRYIKFCNECSYQGDEYNCVDCTEGGEACAAEDLLLFTDIEEID